MDTTLFVCEDTIRIFFLNMYIYISFHILTNDARTFQTLGIIKSLLYLKDRAHTDYIPLKAVT